MSRAPNLRSLVRQLRAGVYVVEIRERDIDLRVQIDSDNLHTELADAYLRHGLHRTVVSLDQPAALRVTLSSVDQRTWRGCRGAAHPALAATGPEHPAR